jgi:hypothetical protein
MVTRPLDVGGLLAELDGTEQGRLRVEA